MALGWLSVLKAVPWSDVVQAAPTIVQGARKLYTAAKSYGDPSVDAQAAHARAREGGENADVRLEQIHAHIEVLQAEQRTSAEIIRSLAEQNAVIVTALDLMRKRMRVLVGFSILLLIMLIALAFAVVAT